MEVDELHSYIGSKKTTYGFGLLWTEQINGCWVLRLETGVNTQANNSVRNSEK